MKTQYSRTEMMLGAEALIQLRNARVAVFGIGGVGGYAVEALARSGVGTLDLIDDDLVCLTNLNRQIIATHSTLGRPKVDVAKARITDIDPTIRVNTFRMFYTAENAAEFDFKQYDYIIDAIDTVSSKISLVCQAQTAGTPIISSMGAGNKLDPTAFRVSDIYQTSVCPLARVMRHELKKRGISKLKVVYSTEPPVSPAFVPDDTLAEVTDATSSPDTARSGPGKRQTPGSLSFVPSVAGLILAGEVIKDLSLR